jgi:hypothetical protein
MQALERYVVRIVACFTGRDGPVRQGGAKGFAYFLLLLVEHLLRHFLPHEPQIPLGGNESKTDIGSAAQKHRPGIAIVFLAAQTLTDRAVSKVTRGENVGDRCASKLRNPTALSEVDFKERPVPASQFAEWMQCLDHTGALCPSGPGPGRQRNHRNFAGFQRRHARAASSESRWVEAL